LGEDLYNFDEFIKEENQENHENKYDHSFWNDIEKRIFDFLDENKIDITDPL
jgi:hypothetical protein